MKKFLTILITLALLVSALGIQVAATGAPMYAYVTIVDGEDNIVLALEEVTLSDVDGDGTVTVNDVLYLAHEAYYNGGAAAGYASSESAYGLSLDKLWGVANGGAYGYYVNHNAANGLKDPVSNGDTVVAFIYSDTATWSDTYCFFDRDTYPVGKGETFTLTLNAAGWSETYEPIRVPVANAVITVDGVATGFRTDENGSVTLSLDLEGKHIVSATSETQNLVPPVCIVQLPTAVQFPPDENVTTEAPATDTAKVPVTDAGSAEPAADPNSATPEKVKTVALCSIGAVAAVAAILVVVEVCVKRRGKNDNE